MGLNSIFGAAAQVAIYAWVRVLGKSIDPDEYPWSKCPVGSPTAVGPQMYSDIAAAENLEQRTSPDAGLLASFEELRSDNFDSSRVDPRIRDFYEKTAAYELEVWSEVGALARPLLWGLVILVSRRMDQLVFPLSPLELSGEVIEMVAKTTNKRVYTGWRRTLLSSNAIIYAGLYSTTVPPNYGRPCVRVTFPVRRGSPVVILRPEAVGDGSFKLLAEGKKFGDPGFYRIVSTGPKKMVRALLPQNARAFPCLCAPGRDIEDRAQDPHPGCESDDHALQDAPGQGHFRLRRQLKSPALNGKSNAPLLVLSFPQNG